MADINSLIPLLQTSIQSQNSQRAEQRSTTIAISNLTNVLLGRLDDLVYINSIVAKDAIRNNKEANLLNKRAERNRKRNDRLSNILNLDYSSSFNDKGSNFLTSSVGNMIGSPILSMGSNILPLLLNKMTLLSGGLGLIYGLVSEDNDEQSFNDLEKVLTKLESNTTKFLGWSALSSFMQGFANFIGSLEFARTQGWLKSTIALPGKIGTKTLAGIGSLTSTGLAQVNKFLRLFTPVVVAFGAFQSANMALNNFKANNVEGKEVPFDVNFIESLSVGALEFINFIFIEPAKFLGNLLTKLTNVFNLENTTNALTSIGEDVEGLRKNMFEFIPKYISSAYLAIKTVFSEDSMSPENKRIRQEFIDNTQTIISATLGNFLGIFTGFFKGLFGGSRDKLSVETDDAKNQLLGSAGTAITDVGMMFDDIVGAFSGIFEGKEITSGSDIGFYLGEAISKFIVGIFDPSDSSAREAAWKAFSGAIKSIANLVGDLFLLLLNELIQITTGKKNFFGKTTFGRMEILDEGAKKYNSAFLSEYSKASSMEEKMRLARSAEGRSEAELIEMLNGENRIINNQIRDIVKDREALKEERRLNNSLIKELLQEALKEESRLMRGNVYEIMSGLNSRNVEIGKRLNADSWARRYINQELYNAGATETTINGLIRFYNNNGAGANIPPGKAGKDAAIGAIPQQFTDKGINISTPPQYGPRAVLGDPMLVEPRGGLY